MSELVGPDVEFAISQRAVLEHHRHGVGLRRRPGLELAVDQCIIGIHRIRSIPGLQQLPALGLRQHRQAAYRRLRGVFQGLHQALQGDLHVATDALGTDLRSHLNGQAEVVTQVIDIQCQRIVGPLFTGQPLHAAPGRQHFVSHLSRAVPIVQKRAEQRGWRGHAAATLGQGQRRMFVAQQAGQAPVGHADRVTHTLPVHRHTHRQGIDEHAQRPVGPFAALHPAQQYRAEHHVFLPGRHAQDLGPGQMDQARGAHTEQSGLGPQTKAQDLTDRLRHLGDTASVALHLGQPEGQRWLIDVSQHLAEERFVFRHAHAQPGLGHVVAIRHGFSQLPGLAGQVRLHLVLHHFQRGMVQRHVMEQQNRQPAVLGFILGVDQLQHRRPTQVQAIVARIEAARQLRGDIAGRGIGFEALRLQRHLAPDQLQRFVQAFPGHAGAQDVMAVDHHLQRFDERLEALQAVESELRLQHVGVALLGGQVVIEDTFL
ncbi:hypothetical protein SRABI112_01683 [Pseudomonas mediterranea]|nr:hypothetical protein SRABI112_01683 [Pseudomonas mediterranea]